MKGLFDILSPILLSAACGFAQEINLFALPREAPMRRVDGPPASAKPGQALLESVARPGEYHVFQLRVVAGNAPLGPLRITFSGLQGRETGIPAAAMECLSLDGIGNDGLPFNKDFEGTSRLTAGGKPVGEHLL